MQSLELPPLKAQRAFNLRRWAELIEDTELAKFQGRIETDRFGHIVMSPPAAASHGSFQSEIGFLLRQLLANGRVFTECPISTADGIKVADVAWASRARVKELGREICFSHAPEICVEVISPCNTDAEIEEKMALYFDSGAQEVWICAEGGAMTFYAATSNRAMRVSRICPRFPKHIELA